MPLDRTPRPAKPWVPDLLFEPVAPPSAPAASAPAQVPEPRPAELATAVAAPVQDPAPQVLEPPAPDAPAIPQAPPASDSDDPAELRRSLAEQERALNKARIFRRNLQEDIAKARRTFMFAERTRLYSAKGALDALIAQEQQSEIEERRLSSDILVLRSKLERLSR
jgi:hypothetical protein